MLELTYNREVIHLDVMNKFQSELYRINQAVSKRKSYISEQRNQALEIDNILLSNDITKNNITGRNLVNLPEQSLKKILEIVNDEEIKVDLNKLAWEDELAQALTEFLNNYTSENTNDLMEAKDPEFLKRLSKKFNASGELISPILGDEMDKFDRFIDLCHELTLKEKAQLKKLVGKANLILVLLLSAQKEQELIRMKKYEFFLNKRLKGVEEYIKILQAFIIKNNVKLSFDLTDEQLKFWQVNNPTLKLKEIIDGIMYLLLKEELNRFYELQKLDPTSEERKKIAAEILENCVRIVALADREFPKKKKTETEIVKKEVEKQPILINEEAKELIEKVNAILKEENSFLQSIHPDDFSRLTLILEVTQVKEAEGENEKYDDYHLAMIIESLRQKLNSFENNAKEYVASPKEHAKKYQTQKSEINDLIEAYTILKERRPGKKIKDNNHLFYLTDVKGNAFINQYLENCNFDKQNVVMDVINKLSDHNYAFSQNLEAKEDYKIYYIVRKNIVLTYALVSETDVIVLMATDRTRKTTNKLKGLINQKQNAIDLLVQKMKNPADRQLLFEEQSNIRGILASYLEYPDKDNHLLKTA